MPTLVLTAIGDERPGLVEELAAVVAARGASWDRSSMARLGSKFAGIVEVSVSEDEIESLVADLAELSSTDALQIRVERSVEPDAVHGVERSGVTTADLAAVDVSFTASLIGQDRPGIVHEISREIAAAGVSIVELRTATMSAPMSAETLFEATATLSAPRDVDRQELAERLEAIADELMVDLDIEVTPA
ncbi:MAG: ACT domain-containing protein [Actinomycetota bacterium]